VPVAPGATSGRKPSIPETRDEIDDVASAVEFALLLFAK
jgi:hypothetical protein